MARAEGWWESGAANGAQTSPRQTLEFGGLRGATRVGCEAKGTRARRARAGDDRESLGRPASGVRGVRSAVVSRSPRAGTRNPSTQVAFALLHDRRRSRTLVRQPSAGGRVLAPPAGLSACSTPFGAALRSGRVTVGSGPFSIQRIQHGVLYVVVEQRFQACAPVQGCASQPSKRVSLARPARHGPELQRRAGQP